MAKLKVPGRPDLEDADYALGGGDPNWMQNFAEGTGTARGDAQGLGVTGKQMVGRSMEAQNRATPQTDFGRSQAVGGDQTGAADWMRDFAQGPQGPSAAQAQLRQGAGQSMRQSLALAKSGSGFGESAGGLASAQRANADTMANVSNQAAMLRAQEDQAFRNQQLQAMSGAADIYGGAAAREGGQAQFLTEAEQQAAAQRDALELGRSGQAIDAMNMGVQGQLAASATDLDAQRAALEGRVAQGQTRADLYGTEADVFATRENRDRALHEQRRADRGEAAGIISEGAAAIGGLLSDERSKEKIRGARMLGRYEALADSTSDSGGGGAAGLAQRDYETYQGGMTPRAEARDYAAFEDADRRAGVQPGAKPAFSTRLASTLKTLSDERSKRKVKQSSLRARYEALSD